MTVKHQAQDIPTGVLNGDTLFVQRIKIAGLLDSDTGERRTVFVGWSPMEYSWNQDWDLRIAMPRFPSRIQEPIAPVELRIAQAISRDIARIFGGTLEGVNINMSSYEMICVAGDLGTLHLTEHQFAYRADIKDALQSLSSHQLLEVISSGDIAYLRTT